MGCGIRPRCGTSLPILPADDRLKATIDVALALYLTGHDYAIDDLCDLAIARGQDADTIQLCLRMAQELAADRRIRRKADLNIIRREIDRHNASSQDAKRGFSEQPHVNDEAPPPEPLTIFQGSMPAVGTPAAFQFTDYRQRPMALAT
jgi:hypothetical protein